MNKGLRCEKPQSFETQTNQAPQPINDRVKGDCSAVNRHFTYFAGHARQIKAMLLTGHHHLENADLSLSSNGLVYFNGLGIHEK